MQSGRRLWVAKTVLLELEWVCRGVYKLEASAFRSIAEHLISLPKVEVEDFVAVRKALDWHAQGLDFADALHLSSSGHAKEFVTFDKRRFASRAQRLETLPVVTTP